MNINTSDYLIVQHRSENRKPVFRLYKTTKVTGSGPITGRLERTPHWKGVYDTFTAKDVVANLGPNPPPGKVYGCDLTQLYQKTIEHRDFGPVHFMCRPESSDLKKLSAAMSSISAKLKKARLSFLLEEGTLIEVVNHAFTKYSGMFHCSKNREEMPSRLTVCADSTVLLANGIDSYEYVLAHELGHALHFHHLKSVPAIDSAWVKAYANSVCPQRVDKEVSLEFLAKLKEERSVSGAVSQMAEEDRESVKLILRDILHTGGLRPRELDLLLATDKDELVESVWPDWDLVLRGLKPKLTMYSTKNYMELFAECFAFWLTGKDIPPKLLKLMERSVSVARGGNE